LAGTASAADAPAKRDDSDDDAAGGGAAAATSKRRPGGGRQPLPKHLQRECIVHDLAEEEMHCATCQQDLRPIGEETSERYEYIPAQLKVVEEVCKKDACDCTVKTATKPSQPIEKSTAGASLLAQVVVAKTADHLPLHRQEKIFARHGADISRKTMCGWLAQCADLLKPLYGKAKEVLFESKMIGTDDTGVKVLDAKLPFGRIWPYYGDRDHPVILYDYTQTRARAGPEEFLKGYRGRLQADTYGGYDAFFKDPARGLIEVGCWGHARRYYFKALESDQARTGPALLRIAQLYRVEEQARGWSPEERLALRQRESRPVLDKLHGYLLEVQAEVLPKSPEGRAVRYTLNNWTALNRYCEDGDLEIDNNHTERSIRGVAVGRNNWIFFGSDQGGHTAAVHPAGRIAAAQLEARAGLIPIIAWSGVGPAVFSGDGDSRTLTPMGVGSESIDCSKKRSGLVPRVGVEPTLPLRENGFSSHCGFRRQQMCCLWAGLCLHLSEMVAV
jgi:transposase